MRREYYYDYDMLCLGERSINIYAIVLILLYKV